MPLLYFPSAFVYPHSLLGRRAQYCRSRQHMSQSRPYASSACPQTWSLLRAHDISLTRFETSSANKANTPDEIIPQILSDIPHHSTLLSILVRVGVDGALA